MFSHIFQLQHHRELIFTNEKFVSNYHLLILVQLCTIFIDSDDPIEKSVLLSKVKIDHYGRNRLKICQCVCVYTHLIFMLRASCTAIKGLEEYHASGEDILGNTV